MKVIELAWDLKCKRYPDGLPKNFKARFFARGDQQLEGIDFYETYATVLHCTKVWLMLDIEVLLRLNYKKGKVTTVFLHADIPENEKVYVETPRGF